MLLKNELRAGNTVHWTNWPGKPSLPCVVLRDGESELQLPGGGTVFAFNDEMYDHPVEGLQ